MCSPWMPRMAAFWRIFPWADSSAWGSLPIRSMAGNILRRPRPRPSAYWVNPPVAARASPYSGCPVNRNDWRCFHADLDLPIAAAMIRAMMDAAADPRSRLRTVSADTAAGLCVRPILGGLLLLRNDTPAVKSCA